MRVSLCVSPRHFLVVINIVLLLLVSFRVVKSDSMMAGGGPSSLAPGANPRRTLLLFGDSITEHGWRVDIRGWAAQLAEHYRRRADVINRGMSGYNTRWAKACLVRDKGDDFSTNDERDDEDDVRVVIPARVDWAVIFFGANDAALPGGSSERQAVPLQEYTENIKEFVREFRRRGATQVVVLSPPPIDHAQRQACAQEKYGEAGAADDRTDEHTQKYAAAAEVAAKEESATFVNIFEKFHQIADELYGGNVGALLSDGLHLNANGNDVVASELRRVLDQPEQCPLDFPLHNKFSSERTLDAVLDEHTDATCN